MITALAAVQAHPTAATLTVMAAMVYGFTALTTAVVRTASASSRHAAFWSPPRAQILTSGTHSETGRRRAEKRAEKRAAKDHRRTYAATRARHTARTVTEPQPVLEPALLVDTVPIGAVVTVPDIRQFARTAC